jgi:hypothetical protein
MTACFIGSGGRPWKKIVWTATAGSGNNASLTALSNILANPGRSLEPITIPGSILNSTRYTISLKLTSWLGSTGVRSVSVIKSTDGNIPTASVLGSLSRTIFVSDTLEIMALGQPSSCSSSTTLFYSWKVYNTYVLDLSIQSLSADPRKLKLNPYTLSPGTTYQCQTSVTSSSGGFSSVMAQVYVASREIAVLVTGGYVRSSPVNKPLLLDASRSADMNLNPALNLPSRLTFSWSCSVASSQSFGSSCNYIFSPASKLNGSVVTVTNMTFGYQYAVYIVCGSMTNDGRTGSATVSISPTAPGAGVVQMLQSSATEFNANSKLKIGARISATDAQIGALSYIQFFVFCYFYCYC